MMLKTGSAEWGTLFAQPAQGDPGPGHPGHTEVEVSIIFVSPQPPPLPSSPNLTPHSTSSSYLNVVFLFFTKIHVLGKNNNSLCKRVFSEKTVSLSLGSHCWETTTAIGLSQGLRSLRHKGVCANTPPHPRFLSQMGANTAVALKTHLQAPSRSAHEVLPHPEQCSPESRDHISVNQSLL